MIEQRLIHTLLNAEDNTESKRESVWFITIWLLFFIALVMSFISSDNNIFTKVTAESSEHYTKNNHIYCSTSHSCTLLPLSNTYLSRKWAFLFPDFVWEIQALTEAVLDFC